MRAIWRAYERQGVEGLRELAGPDVEWIPYSGGGKVHAGPAGLLEWSEQAEIRASVHGYETYGPCVLVHGSLRVFREGGFLDIQPSWVFFFREDRLIRAVAYATREEALTAITEYRARA